MVMPTFAMSTHNSAPVEEVWKLLDDPTAFPEWWEGVETVAPGPTGEYILWSAGYSDFPVVQQLQCSPGQGRVRISCLVSDVVFRWQLREAGQATAIDVHFEIPVHEAHRLPGQRRVLERSLKVLANLAARTC